MSPKKITVIGTGAWGTALAAVKARNGHDIILYGRNKRTCDEIMLEHENQQYLPGIALPEGLQATNDMEMALHHADLVLVVTPAQTTREVAKAMAPFMRAGVPVLACAKGIDKMTGQLQSEVLLNAMPDNPVGVLSGPSFADDVARGLPTALVLAMHDIGQAQELSQILSNKHLRFYASSDLTGVQIGGALKNILAIATGICRGGGLGASAEAALITRGHAEISRLALALGARRETLMGLSCLGDLILTCSSTLSRNFSYGIAIGKGQSVEGMKLAEGVHTLEVAHDLAQKAGIDTPIIAVTREILAGGMSMQDAYLKLMQRPIRLEDE